MTKIYALTDPCSGKIVYIGETKKTLGMRLTNHICSKTKGDLQLWIKKLVENGDRPGIILIDEIPDTEITFWETHYIWLFRSWDYNLFNKYEGGKSRVEIKKVKHSTVLTNTCPLIVLDKNNNVIKEFDSKIDASRELNIDINRIDEILSGRKSCGKGLIKVAKSYKGYTFVRKKDYDPNKDYTVTRKKEYKGKYGRIVQQYDLQGNLINEYVSTTDANRKTGIDCGMISNVCNGKKHKTAGGYIWKYKIVA